jgi:1,4-alpha-glucan branching enzyme
LPTHREKDAFKPVPKNEKIIYEMHIGTFNKTDPSESGTFASAADKINHLTDLGVNTIEIMPIHSMNKQHGWGYEPEYIYSVETSYGGRNHFADFVEVAHKAGHSVILDVVYNHLGAPDKTDLWQFDGWFDGNKGGIYFYNDWRSKTPWGDTRLDYGRPEVFSYVLNNAKMWLEDFKIDGLRLDSTIYLRNVDGQNNNPNADIPEAWELLKDINDSAKKINKNSLIIAEDASTNEYITKNIQDGGAGFDAQWDCEFASAIRSVLEPTKDEDRNLAWLVSALTKKFNSQPMERIIFTDSHDTAANGKHRLNTEINPKNIYDVYSKKRSLIAAALLLTAPGIPMLLQGQEFMQSGDFNSWQGLDWENVDKYRGILLAHKHLIALRKNTHNVSKGLTGNNIKIIHTDDSKKLLAYHRWNNSGPGDDVVVITNLSNRLVHNLPIYFPSTGEWELRFDSSWHGYSDDFKKYDVLDINVTGETANVDVPPYTVLIYSQNIA